MGFVGFDNKIEIWGISGDFRAILNQRKKRKLKFIKLFDVTWLISGLSFIGAILNAKKNRLGFCVWILSGILYIRLDLQRGWYGHCFFTILNCAISIWGIHNWKTKE